MNSKKVTQFAHIFTRMASSAASSLTLQDRLTGALWGMFIADALSMPAHWYYSTGALQKDYGRITEYTKVTKPHPTSIMFRSFPRTHPRADIHGEQAKYYGPAGKDVHYHAFLPKGGNTVNLQVCRAQLRNIASRGSYDVDSWLQAYADYMLKDKRADPNPDTYVEPFHCYFFENYGKGKPLRECCGPEDHDTAEAGGIVNIIPIILSKATAPALEMESTALTHLRLTHESSTLEPFAQVYTHLMRDLVHGSDPQVALKKAGERLGMDDLDGLSKLPPASVVGRMYSPACYIQHTMPSAVYFAAKYGRDAENALVENVMVGGDNCYRGGMLGAILGAAYGPSVFPRRWIEGLHSFPAIEKEIAAFVATTTGSASASGPSA